MTWQHEVQTAFAPWHLKPAEEAKRTAEPKAAAELFSRGLGAPGSSNQYGVTGINGGGFDTRHGP